MLRRIARKVLGRSNRSPEPEPPHSASRPPTATAPTKTQHAPPKHCQMADLSALEAKLYGPGNHRLIIHWATWCSGCLEELPALMALHERIGADVEFIGVSWDGFQGGQSNQHLLQTVDQFIHDRSIPWDSMVVDVHPDQFFDGLKMSCRTVPQLWIVDADGSLNHQEDSVLTLADVDDFIERFSVS